MLTVHFRFPSLARLVLERPNIIRTSRNCRVIVFLLKDGACYCYCAYVLRISRYSGFLSVMLANTGIFLQTMQNCRVIVFLLKDGACYCYCAYVLRISRYSGFLSVMLANTGIFLRGFKQKAELSKCSWYPKRKLWVTMHSLEIIKLQFERERHTLLCILELINHL